MGCKGRCEPFRATKGAGVGRYSQGQKRCQVCDLFIEFSGLWCPCCGYRLRTKPRNKKYKELLAETKGKKGNKA